MDSGPSAPGPGGVKVGIGRQSVGQSARSALGNSNVGPIRKVVMFNRAAKPCFEFRSSPAVNKVHGVALAPQRCLHRTFWRLFARCRVLVFTFDANSMSATTEKGTPSPHDPSGKTPRQSLCAKTFHFSEFRIYGIYPLTSALPKGRSRSSRYAGRAAMDAAASAREMVAGRATVSLTRRGTTRCCHGGLDGQQG